MEAYIMTALGILVSVGLFLLGYKQTIGARRERVRTANKAVNRALLRRMVLEEYKPRYKDIARIQEVLKFKMKPQTVRFCCYADLKIG